MLPIWTFLAVTVPLVLTPGVSTAIVLRNSLARGTRAGVQTAIGVNSGSLLYGLLTAFGLALALQRWPSIWTILRALGVGYLAWLGIRSLRSALHPAAPPLLHQPARLPSDDHGQAFRNVQEGFLANTLNPAIASFYLIVIPQFVPRGAPVLRSVLILAAIHITLALTWHLVWAGAGGAMARGLAHGRPRRIIDALTGIALLALAFRMALPK